MRSRISPLGIMFSDTQWLEFPTSMNSMNRSQNPFCRANSTRGRMSSSLTPRWITELILIGSKPRNRAVSSPSRTPARSSRRVRARNFAGLRVSRLALIRPRPARSSPAACSFRCEALVVRERSLSPPRPARAETRVSSPCRNRGSPPVSRISSTPDCKNSPARRVISSKVRISLRSIHSYCSSGMQYTHRKLHRSVTDILRSLSSRPRVSLMLTRSTSIGSSSEAIPAAPSPRPMIARAAFQYRTSGGSRQPGAERGHSGPRRAGPVEV